MANQRNAARETRLTVLVALLCALCLGPGAAAGAAPTPPNIVILFADDLGYGDLGSYGHPYNRTPNLDRIAAEGQRWTDFYAPAPVCSPSRAALLTGRLPNRTGLYGRQIAVLFPNSPVGLPAAEHTLGEALQAVGYRTAIIGKWHLGDAPEHLPTRHGFDYWYGIPYSNDMDWTNEPDFDELMMMNAAQGREAVLAAVAKRQGKYFEPEIEYWNVPLMRSRVTAAGYSDEEIERPARQQTITRRYTEEALRFIQRSKDAPFLLYLPYSMPHTPLFRSKQFAGRSLGGRYGDVIEEIDWSVGEIVAGLRKHQLAENTLLVFTSDNGPWLTMNHHGGTAGLLNNGKGTTFEGGMRVPAIFWWPGRIAPAVVSGIGSAMDLYSTALALAGARDRSAATDAVDLSAALTRGTASPRSELAYYRSGELRAYRMGDFKLHLITAGAYGQPPVRTEHTPPLLFNLREDPAERFDVASTHPEVVAEIQRAIKRHRAALAEQPPLFDARLQRLAP